MSRDVDALKAKLQEELGVFQQIVARMETADALDERKQIHTEAVRSFRDIETLSGRYAEILHREQEDLQHQRPHPSAEQSADDYRAYLQGWEEILSDHQEFQRQHQELSQLIAQYQAALTAERGEQRK